MANKQEKNNMTLEQVKAQAKQVVRIMMDCVEETGFEPGETLTCFYPNVLERSEVQLTRNDELDAAVLARFVKAFNKEETNVPLCFVRAVASYFGKGANVSIA